MITRRHALGTIAALPWLLPGNPMLASRPPTCNTRYLREQLDTIIAQQVPGALVATRTSTSDAWARAGVADRRTGRPPDRADRFRIASITKTFVATVVLQLIAEGHLRLDDPIGRYIPRLLPDQDTITIRYLLQHTSGLPDYHDYDGLNSAAAYLAHRYDDPSPRASIALATAHPLLFAPGTAWSYADTNYLVLGMLAERLAGTTIGTQITERLLEPLRLDATSFPEHTPLIRGTHLHGYMPTDLPGVPFGDTALLADFTYELVNLTGAAGAMISNAPDLLRFLHALMRGHLLPPSLMKEMTTTVPVGAAAAATGLTGYGLGLARFDVGNGTPMWGSTGLIRGYTSALLATRDASRQLAAVATLNPPSGQAATAITQAIAAIAQHITAS